MDILETLEELCDAPTDDQAPAFNVEKWEAGGGELARHNADVKWNIGDWLVRGRELAKRDGEVKWELGDWLVEGEPLYPCPAVGDIPGVTGCDFYAIAENITGLSRGTLYDLSTTARRVPVSVRTETCTWSHHRMLINALPEADEETLKDWLKRATDDKMTVRELREALRSPVKEAVKQKSFRVTVPLRVWEGLRDFAAHERSTPQTKAAEWLEENICEAEAGGTLKAVRELVQQRRTAQRRRVGLKVARTYDPLGLQKE